MTEPEYRTRTGKTLSEPDIEALADEAEAGYDLGEHSVWDEHMTGHFNEDGSPATLRQHLGLMRDIERRRVGKDAIGDHANVSTVFIGMDVHADITGDSPRTFESQVWVAGWEDALYFSYSSRPEAELGHRRIVEALSAGPRTQMELAEYVIKGE